MSSRMHGIRSDFYRSIMGSYNLLPWNIYIQKFSFQNDFRLRSFIVVSARSPFPDCNFNLLIVAVDNHRCPIIADERSILSLTWFPNNIALSLIEVCFLLLHRTECFFQLFNIILHFSSNSIINKKSWDRILNDSYYLIVRIKNLKRNNFKDLLYQPISFQNVLDFSHSSYNILEFILNLIKLCFNIWKPSEIYSI